MKIFIPLSKIPTATLQEQKAAYIKGRIVMYEPANVKKTKRELKAHLKPYKPTKPLDGPLSVYVRWHFPIAKKKQWNTWKTTRGDLDNLAKMLMDRMTELKFWNDDSQIVSLLLEKIYVEPGKGGIQMEIIEIRKEPYKL